MLAVPWKWFVLIGAFLSRVVTTGTVVCMGVFFNEFKDSFESWDNARVAFVFSTAIGLLEGMGIVASALMKKFESRYLVMGGAVVAGLGVALASQATDFVQMIICLGVMNGIGQGIARCLMPVAVAHSFHERERHIAISLQNVGDGVGGLIFPLFFKHLIDRWSWRGAILITAGLVLQLVLCGAVVEKHLTARKKSTTVAVDRDRRWSCQAFVESIRRGVTRKCADLSPSIVMLCSNILLHSIGYYIFMTFIYRELTMQRIDESLASAMFACVGGVSIVGRLSVSLMATQRVPRWSIYAGAHLVRGLLVLAFNAVPRLESNDHRVAAYFTLCSAFGLTDGVTGALIAVVCLDLFGLHHMGDVYGLLLFFMGSGAWIGPPIAGALMNAFSGSAFMPLVLSGVAFIVSGLVLIPLYCTKKHYQLATTIEEEKAPIEMEELAPVNT